MKEGRRERGRRNKPDWLIALGTAPFDLGADQTRHARRTEAFKLSP